MTTASPKIAQFPATVVIDTREQLRYSFASVPLSLRFRFFNRTLARRSPYSFAAVPAAPYRGMPRTFIVPTVVKTLRSGDYSVLGSEKQIAVERKSAADLFGTVGQGRERFVRELARLSAMQFAAVVVEADLSEILAHPPNRSKLRPRAVVRSVLAWQQRYPRVHWWFCPGRAAAEIITLRIFERWVADAALRAKGAVSS